MPKRLPLANQYPLYGLYLGATGYVQYPKAVASSILSAQSLTVELWIYWKTLATNKYSVVGVDGAGFFLRSSPSDASKTDFEIYDSGTWYALISSTSIVANRWCHIVATWDGATMKLYFNGVQDPNTLAHSKMTDRALTGANSFGSPTSGQTPDAVFSLARLYNRALSQAEIWYNMYNSLSPVRNGLLLFFPMVEGSGTTVADYSGQGNNGTLSGGVSWNTLAKYEIPAGAML
jgi:hypothetical protein